MTYQKHCFIGQQNVPQDLLSKILFNQPQIESLYVSLQMSYIFSKQIPYGKNRRPSFVRTSTTLETGTPNMKDFCPLPNFSERRSRSRSFTFFGAALALPLSYFFQSGARAHLLKKKSAALLALSFQSNFENVYPIDFFLNCKNPRNFL